MEGIPSGAAEVVLRLRSFFVPDPPARWLVVNSVERLTPPVDGVRVAVEVDRDLQIGMRG
jgi:hypothetical protein